MANSRKVTLARLVGLSLVALLGGACGVASTAPSPYDLLTAGPVAESGELVYAAGQALHVGDETHTLTPAPDGMVTTAGGLYYRADEVLFLWDGKKSERVADIGGGSLSTLFTTTSGRYLGFIDFEHGPTNSADEHVGEAVVFDTVTGKQIIRDHTGNGDPSDDDLADLYSEDPPTFMGFDDKHAYVRTPSGGFVSYDLATGEAHPTKVFPEANDRPDGQQIGFEMDKQGAREYSDGMGAPMSGRLSFDSKYVAFAVPAGPFVFTYPEGTPRALAFAEAQFVVAGWLDEDTFLGTGYREDAEGVPSTAAVYTCELDTLSCKQVSGRASTEREHVFVFPFGGGALG